MRTAAPHVALGARALWAGPGARRALAAGGRGRVEFALRPGGDRARLGEAWLLLAVPRAPRGPLTLLVAGLTRPRPWPRATRSRPHPRASVEFHNLWLWNSTLARCARVRCASISSRLGRASPALVTPPLAPGWRLALTGALEAAPQPPRELVDGLAALRRGELDSGVAALAGRGAGLTPAGDDVLAGYAGWRHAQGEPVVFDGARCSPLGLAYLRCAERGELPDPAAAVLRAIRDGDAIASERRARALSRWGELGRCHAVGDRGGSQFVNEIGPNFIARPYRGVSVQDAPSLEAGALLAHVRSRRVYRRTEFIVAVHGDERALVQLEREDAEGILVGVRDARVLAGPDEVAFVVDAAVDTANASQLARVAVPGARVTVVEGRFQHVNFIVAPAPLRIRVVEVVPPFPPKLLDMARTVLEYDEELPPLALDLVAIDLRELAAQNPSDHYLFPCRCAGLELGAPVDFLTPARRSPRTGRCLAASARARSMRRSTATIRTRGSTSARCWSRARRGRSSRC